MATDGRDLIPVYCRTNLDGFESVEWPTVMCTRPLVGDYVDGERGDKRPRLRVCAVTHQIDRDGAPRLYVELHK